MKQELNQEYREISELLGNYLRREQLEITEIDDSPLDEDTLSAFVEGRLSEREVAPILRRLVKSPSALHITAQLVKLQSEFESDDFVPNYQTKKAETGRLKSFFGNLVAGIFPTGESVFAHEEKTEDGDENKSDSPESEKKE